MVVSRNDRSTLRVSARTTAASFVIFAALVHFTRFQEQTSSLCDWNANFLNQFLPYMRLYPNMVLVEKVLNSVDVFLDFFYVPTKQSDDNI